MTPTTEPPKRPSSRLALGCLAMGGLMLLVLLIMALLPSQSRTAPSSTFTDVSRNARGLFQALLLHVYDHQGLLPAKLTEIDPEAVGDAEMMKKLLQGPPPEHDPEFFTLLHPGEKLDSLPDTEPVLISKPVRGKFRVIVRANGTVEAEKIPPKK